MRKLFRIRFIIATLVVAVGILVIVIFCWPLHDVQAGLFEMRDAAFEFRFSKITRGTNHEVIIGNAILAKVNRKLYHSPLQSVCRLLPGAMRGGWYERSTPTNSTILWVGWTHKDYNLMLTNRIPDSYNPGFSVLHCDLVEPGGNTTSLPFFTSVLAPLRKECVGAWEIPANVTNLAGCHIRLKKYGAQQDVAELKLQ